MKNIIFFIALLLTLKGFSQNSDLFRLWYLTKVTINNTDYISSDYGYYPDLAINYTDSLSLYSFTLADPDRIVISCGINDFFSNPDSFILDQAWFELPTAMCYDGPDGPCTTIYGKHAEMYLDIFTPFNYTINQNNDEFTLEIVNTEQNHAYYSSIPLSVDEFLQPQLTLYPNPVKNVLHINSTEIISEVSVYDIHGKVVKSIDVNSQSIEINVTHLPAGMYFVKTQTLENHVITQRFLKK